jgi:hypothetical protein
VVTGVHGLRPFAIKELLVSSPKLVELRLEAVYGVCGVHKIRVGCSGKSETMSKAAGRGGRIGTESQITGQETKCISDFRSRQGTTMYIYGLIYVEHDRSPE